MLSLYGLTGGFAPGLHRATVIDWTNVLHVGRMTYLAHVEHDQYQAWIGDCWETFLALRGDAHRFDPLSSVPDRAKGYDASGIRALETWRKEAVTLLNVERGDPVVDIGCGTGLNFAQKAIGPEGRSIGVDLTDAMLDQARLRVAEQGWKHVELVQSDAIYYKFPTRVESSISTLALTCVPDCERVIQNGCQA